MRNKDISKLLAIYTLFLVFKITADGPQTYYPDFFRTELANPVDYVKHFVTKAV